jgi:hypothetical protein
MLRILVFQTLALSTAFATSYLGYSDYQVVTDPSFPAGRYFETMAESGVNFQRIWALGYSGVDKKIPERLPFVRQGKYDLEQIDSVYLDRLKSVLRLANQNGQKVMLTLFDNWSLGTRTFERTPWYSRNNYQRLKVGGRKDFYSVENKELLRIQEHFVRTIVANTKDSEPIYEIVNEGSGVACDQLDEWHGRVASWIEQEAPNAQIGVNVSNACASIFGAPWADVISLHGDNWRAKPVCDYVERYPDKLVIMDTDGAWKTRNDNRLVKKWLSEAMSCGASFNHKDDIYNLDREVLQIYKTAK